MIIRRESVLSLDLPYRERMVISRTVFAGGSGPRMAVVAGVHGDELEGLYLCHLLAVWLERLALTRPQALLGQVELYPAVNPLGLDTLSREVPVFDADLNRSFPGHAQGSLPQRIADALMRHLQGAALVIDVHASNRFLRELPQARVAQEHAPVLLPFARSMNLELIWLHGSITETTMKYQLNRRGVPCIVVEMGIGMRLTAGYAQQLMTGILHLWRSYGLLTEDVELPPLVHRPRILSEGDIRYLNAPAAGMFVPLAAHGARVHEGELLGQILSPHQGEPLAQVQAPAAGTLFTLREFPLVYEGSLMGRIAVAQESA